MCTPVKHFRISAQGFFHVPKTVDFGTVDSRVFVIVAGQTAQFPAMRIIYGLVDIPSMCLLYLTFAGGRTVLAL